MPATTTVADLIDVVESQIDDSSEVDITRPDVLATLNRAQDYASNILARHYPDPLLQQPLTVPTEQGRISYPIPEDLFEDRIKGVEVFNQEANIVWPMTRISYADRFLYETPSTTPIPGFYCIIGHEISIVPPPSGAYPIRIWSMREPETLVYPQGRITHIDADNNIVLVDDAGTDLTTETDNLNSYVNIVDAQTGLVKVSLQIQNITDNQITFKSVPQRSQVLNKEIEGEIPTTGDNPPAADDYICVVKGTCVPYLKKPFSNFMIQYAVVELKRRIGEDVTQEVGALREFEKQVERQWVGRQEQLRVQKRSRHWYRPFRRFWRS